jgi:hypothetical protein
MAIASAATRVPRRGTSMRRGAVQKQNRRSNQFVSAFCLLFFHTILSSCSSIEGYPTDPENTDQVILSLQRYFDPAFDVEYYGQPDPLLRRQVRDSIVTGQMRAYDIEFARFERALYGNGNLVSTGGDLAVLALGAVAATTGGASAKAALAAASAGVVGAQGAISKDLYYQRTIPALIAQMEANRANAKAALVSGLSHTDTEYPLALAYMDLATLKNAGGIPKAISNVTQSAATNAAIAEDDLQNLRSVRFSPSSSRTLIQSWLRPNGVLVKANRDALLAWLKRDPVNPKLARIPFEQFLISADLESDRRRAIDELHIP